MTQKTDMFLQLIDNQYFAFFFGGGKSCHIHFRFFTFHAETYALRKHCFPPGGFWRAVAERQPIELVEMADGKGKNTTPLRQAQ